MKLTVSIKVGLVVFFGIVVIVAAGIFTYRSLSSMVQMLREESSAQEGTTYIKEISTSYQQAESNIRLYGLTQSNIYFSRYQDAVSSMDSSMHGLLNSYPDDTLFTQRILSLDSLIGNVELLWEEMLFIWQSNDKLDELNELSSRYLRSVPDSVSQERVSAFLNSEGKKYEELLERELMNYEMLERITEIARSERTLELSILEKEKELANSGLELNETLLDLMSRLEAYEASLEQIHYDNAEAAAKKTYTLLGVVSVFLTLLSIIAFIMVIQYIRRTRDYNRVLLKSSKEAEELARSKEIFMANVSHEIRNPLNAISGYIKQLLKTPVDPELKEKLSVVDSAGDQLVRLINYVLDFSRLQAGKLELHTVHFDPAVTLSRTIQLFEAQAVESETIINYEIDNPGDIILKGDEHRLRQILSNLLSNAIKFTEKGRIDIHVKIEAVKDKQRMFLQVSDTGSGIEKSKLDEVFREYTQEEQSTYSRYGGTGLGLSIVKSLVELFEGEIQLESEKGKGTTVTCELPFEEGAREAIEAELESEVELEVPEGWHVLLVDDEDYNRSLMASILDKWKISYDLAENGQQALDQIKERDYNMVLMDFRMPEMDGITASRHIRYDLGFDRDKLPIIGVTADTSKHSILQDEDLFNAVLVKPFTEEDLKYLLGKGKLESQDLKIKMEKGENGINLEGLLRLAGNDMEFVLEMVQKYLHSAENAHVRFKQLRENNERKQLGDLAHSMIPSSRHLGFSDLVLLLKELETDTEKKELEDLDIILKDVYRELAKASDSCRKLSSELASQQ